MGDVVAYATGSSLSDFVPVATTSTYGLVRYDGTTIGKNSSGQLYVIGGTGGSGSVSWGDITGKPNVLSTVSTSGSGNAVTNVSYNGSTITVTKGNISGGGTSVSWGSDTGNTVYLSVAGTQKQLVLASGISVGNLSSSQYRSVNLVGQKMDLSLNGHTHSQYLTSVSLSRSTSGSGNVVDDVTVSGSRITVHYSNISSSSWNGGTVDNPVNAPRFGAGGPSSIFRLAVFGNAYIRDSLYIGTTSSEYMLSVNGNMTVTGRIDEGSDIRFKTIVSDVEGILDHILTTRVFRYYWKGSDILQIGVSAQDVKEWMPEVVGFDTDHYTLHYTSFATACAIQGIKELYARFRPVENRVKVLESRVRNLQQRLDNAYREIFNLKEGKEDAA